MRKLLARSGLMMALLWPGSSQAQLGPLMDAVRENPLILLADKITGSLRTQTFVLTGRVRLAVAQTRLSADRVEISPQEVRLSGQVKLTTPEGGLLAQRIQINLRDESLRLENLFLQTARGYATARLATRDGQGRITARQMLFSTCAGCYESRPAPWEVFVREARYTPGDEQIRLTDIQLSLFGQPVLRLPFWQLLNPAITRFTGYLPVESNSTSAGGSGLRGGRFWAINAQEDVTVWASLYGDGAVLGEARYRWARANAWLEASARAAWLQRGSEAHAFFGQRRQQVGDLALSGDWFIDGKSRLRGAGRWLSDPDFSEGFGPSDADYGRAYLQWQRFDRRAYSQATLAQDQLQTSAASAPYTQSELPLRVLASHEDRRALPRTGAGAARLEGFWGLDFNGAFRDQGRESARLAAYGGVGGPALPVGGGLLKAEGFVIALLAHSQGVDVASDAVNPATPTFSGTTRFGLAGGTLDWSADLLSPFGAGLVLRPRLRLTHIDGGGGGGPDGRLANEDTRLPYLTHATQWRAPYAGPFDRLRPGTWVDTGLGFDGAHGGWLTKGFAGLRLVDDAAQEDTTLVSAQALHPARGVDAAYEGRWAADSGLFLGHDVRVSAPLGAWTVGLGYAVEEGASGARPGEEISLTLAGAFSEAWSGSFSLSDDLRIEDEAVFNARVRFEDCCLGLNFYLEYDENGGDQETSLGFELDLIGLGLLGSQSFISL